jgi:magnesium chelatase family protein
MSLARTRGVVIAGVDGLIVDIEAYLSQGLPGMNIVGLPDTAVGESRDRVRAAVLNSKLPWPSERRITIGLSPASVHKRGAFLDLGIALAILMSHGAIPDVNGAVAIGELALDGQVRPVRGVLMAALAVHRAGGATILVPHSQVAEAQLVPDIKVVGVSCLADAVAWSRGEHFDVEPIEQLEVIEPTIPNLSDVRGQTGARVALEIAAAGGHHLGLMGSPGVGKTMLAERLPGILPTLDDELAVEVTAIHSVAGNLAPGQGLMRLPPFQAPHHTATTAALIGGGSHFARVGMVTLAHGGVLCLDEAAEFDRAVLDSLRQPMESGLVTIARTGFQAKLPARFQLVMASNPCPCGKFVGTGADCSCTSLVRRRYFSRLSGPLLDRIDIRVTLDRPTLAQLQAAEVEDSATVAARVLQARERAARRYRECPWTVNAHVPGPYLRRHFPLEPAANELLNRDAVKLSLRGADRVMRVAWTIADLTGHDQPTITDVASALTYRDGNGAWQVS